MVTIRGIAGKTTLLLCQLAIVVVVLVLWEWGVRTERLDASFFGSPEGVWQTLEQWSRDGTLVTETTATLRLLLVGLTIGTLAGASLGVLVSASPMTRLVLEPILVFLNGIPRLVLQPFFIVAFGLGFASRVALVVAVIVILVAVSVSSAMDSVEESLITNARLMGASRFAILRNVYLPWVSLDVIANARSNVGFAFQAALVAEFVGSASGLGYLIVLGQNTFFIEAIWAALVIVVVISVVLDRGLRVVQTRASRWMPAPAG